MGEAKEASKRTIFLYGSQCGKTTKLNENRIKAAFKFMREKWVNPVGEWEHGPNVADKFPGAMNYLEGLSKHERDIMLECAEDEIRNGHKEDSAYRILRLWTKISSLSEDEYNRLLERWREENT